MLFSKVLDENIFGLERKHWREAGSGIPELNLVPPILLQDELAVDVQVRPDMQPVSTCLIESCSKKYGASLTAR